MPYRIWLLGDRQLCRRYAGRFAHTLGRDTWLPVRCLLYTVALPRATTLTIPSSAAHRTILACVRFFLQLAVYAPVYSYRCCQALTTDGPYPYHSALPTALAFWVARSVITLPWRWPHYSRRRTCCPHYHTAFTRCYQPRPMPTTAPAPASPTPLPVPCVVYTRSGVSHPAHLTGYLHATLPRCTTFLHFPARAFTPHPCRLHAVCDFCVVTFSFAALPYLRGTCGPAWFTYGACAFVLRHDIYTSCLLPWTLPTLPAFTGYALCGG